MDKLNEFFTLIQSKYENTYLSKYINENITDIKKYITDNIGKDINKIRRELSIGLYNYNKKDIFYNKVLLEYKKYITSNVPIPDNINLPDSNFTQFINKSIFSEEVSKTYKFNHIEWLENDNETDIYDYLKENINNKNIIEEIQNKFNLTFSKALYFIENFDLKS